LCERSVPLEIPNKSPIGAYIEMGN
jgi:hypothetical protein